MVPQRSYHPGPQLDPATLPELPPEEQPALLRSLSTRSPRKTTADDHRRGDAYTQDGLLTDDGEP